ncbi:XrtA/PEP-CTERM system exopolysaccharide export protein [Neptunomonas antarctica]|uniref:Polysaccharide export outer membrane protein n=1 Tax=Neptunomonas antarctica TaxID=619304 RepID=A0A1N7JE88_9GAMM|nr:XrtA/PEP-CTERM system exopolysaccharide export protein [Neptunomonas antarctica]SIS47556.1 polysaccharide export outer membrane protein [Neptunomonas antarctica]
MLVFSGNVTKRILVLGLASVVLGLSGCSSTNYPQVSEEERFVQPDYNYVIGAGDSVQIFVWGNAELSTSVTVRPDGKITTNLVEDLEASSKTSTELAREIESVYSEYIKNPVVTVIVNNFVTIPDHQIRVVGAGASPLKLPYSKHMTLLDLMIAIGGLNEFADGNKAVLIRRFDGDQSTYGLRLDSLLKDGDITANLALKPGDIVIIPEAWF